MEAEHLAVAKAADEFAVDPRAERGRTVVEHLDVVAASDLGQGCVVAGDAVHIYAKNGDRARRDAALDVLRVDAHRLRINLGEYRLCATPAHGVRRRRERKGRNDYFAALDIGRTEHRHQGNLSIAERDRWNAEVVGELL